MALVDLNGREPGGWTPGEDTDYVGIYYLNSEDGAYTFGHAALLFVREDGSGTFYSFAASRSEALNIVLGNDVPGYLSRADLSTERVDVFLGNRNLTKGERTEDKLAKNKHTTDVFAGLVPVAGQVWTDGIDGPFMDGEKTPYSRHIYQSP